MADKISEAEKRQKLIAASIGGRVKLRRLELGLTQPQLAKKAKTSLTTINRLEKGRQVPHQSTLSEIAAALNLPDSAFRINILTRPEGYKPRPETDEQKSERLTWAAESVEADRKFIIERYKNIFKQVDEIPTEVWDQIVKIDWDNIQPNELFLKLGTALGIETDPLRQELIDLVVTIPSDKLQLALRAVRVFAKPAVQQDKIGRRR